MSLATADPIRLVHAVHDAALDFFGGRLRTTCYDTSAALRRVLLRAGEPADVTYVHTTVTTRTGAAPFAVTGIRRGTRAPQRGRLVTTPHVAVLWGRGVQGGGVWLLDATIDQAEVVEGQRPAPLAVPVTTAWLCGEESLLVESHGLLVQYTTWGIAPRRFQASLVAAITRRLVDHEFLPREEEPTP